MINRMTVKKSSVLIVCGDPGGASAVAPVIKLLESENRLKLKTFAYNEAGSIWDSFEIDYQNIPNDFSRGEMLSLMKEPEVKLLFTGTSVNTFDLEKQFISAAREIGIPSLSLIDFWTNYTWRFSDKDTRLVYLPDKIAIMDEFAFDEMVREGFDPSILEITGQPAFDDLASWSAGFSADRRDEVRDSLGVARDEIFVLFASQPLTSLYGTDVVEEIYLGFDEWVVLETLIYALDEIKIETGAKIHLLIRPHPRESVELFHEYTSDIIPVTVVDCGTARSQVMTADLVIGMNTELLVEACYMGCIALSLQPGLRHPDRLPTNRLGFSRSVYHQEAVKPALLELLLDDSARAAMLDNVKKFKLKGKSAGNVVRLIHKMITPNQKSEEKL
jgi:predicted glycosyltransferase